MSQIITPVDATGRSLRTKVRLDSQQQLRRLLRRDLMSYAQAVAPGYETPKHLKQLNLMLMMAERGIIKRLLITMPPRHGKSYTISQIFPSWYLGRNPDNSVIMTSYSGALAWLFGTQVRENMKTRAFKVAFGGPGGVNLDSRTPKQINMIGHRGQFYATGVSGGITGRGADLFIVDDPLKDAAEANSDRIREKVWEWFSSTAYTRLMPDAVMIVIMTRWHEDDLTGRILRTCEQPGSEEWHHLHLPAIDDAGRPLWPERFPVSSLNRIRAIVGGRVWESLYQGKPAPPEGALFKREWFHVWQEPLSPNWERVRYWDIASTDSEKSDYTVGLLMARTPDGRYIVEHVLRGQFSAAQRNLVMRQTAERDYALYGSHVKTYWEHQPGAAGVDLSLAFKNHVFEGFRAEADAPKGNKEMRFDPVQVAGETGRIFITEGPWLSYLIDEWTVFPFGSNDDTVDAGSGAYRMLAMRGGNFVSWLKSRYGESVVDPELPAGPILVDSEAARMKEALDNIAGLDPEDDAVQEAIERWTKAEEKGLSPAGLGEEVAVQDILIADDVKPGALDFMLNTYFSAALIQVNGEYFMYDGCYVIRCFGNADYLAFALERQGYARIARILEGTVDDEVERLGLPT